MKKIRISSLVTLDSVKNRRTCIFAGEVITYERDGELFRLDNNEMIYSLDNLNELPKDLPEVFCIKGYYLDNYSIYYIADKEMQDVYDSIMNLLHLVEQENKYEASYKSAALELFSVYQKMKINLIEKNRKLSLE